ncbi:MAG TPA: anti-sigma factor [Ktedonobacteraceae bacterium]|nr:anti-sigma factor [Ktedonobacteraceae bacterium]
MNCKEFEEISGAFALDAVTPQERREAETHLAECPRCSKLYHELRAVVDLLPLSVPQVNPSSSLENRLMSTIREESTHKSNDSQRQHRRPDWQKLAVLPLVASVVILFALLGVMTAWNISLQHQLTSLQYAQFAPQIITVQGSGAELGVSGELIYYPQQDITVLIMHNLPRLQGTQVYQGWLLRGTQTTSIGLLNVQNGTASVTFQGNARAQGYNTTAVSVEPGPNATQGAPKGRVVAIGVINTSSH